MWFLLLMNCKEQVKVGSFFKHIHPCIQQSLEITFLYSGNLLSWGFYATLCGWAGILFYFLCICHDWNYGKRMCGCPNMNSWTNRDVCISFSCPLAGQKLIWTLQHHCKIQQWQEPFSVYECYEGPVSSNQWQLLSREVYHGARTCWIQLPKEIYL